VTEVLGEQNCHEVGGRHPGSRVAGARRGCAANAVHAQLRSQFLALLHLVCHTRPRLPFFPWGSHTENGPGTQEKVATGWAKFKFSCLPFELTLFSPLWLQWCYLRDERRREEGHP